MDCLQQLAENASNRCIEPCGVAYNWRKAHGTSICSYRWMMGARSSARGVPCIFDMPICWKYFWCRLTPGRPLSVVWRLLRQWLLHRVATAPAAYSCCCEAQIQRRA